MGNCIPSSSLPEVQCQRGSARAWSDLPINEVLECIADRLGLIEGSARAWSDLPIELLECIADRLGLIELLSFRGVCKSWKAATSTASAQTDEPQPWFLAYGGGGGENSTLFAESGRKYSLCLPELEGATCLASDQGWLLLYRQRSLFFFCPFSRALIHLPAPLPPPLISHAHRAAAQFSSPPTSHGCAVCVIVRSGEHQWKIYRIRRGADAWTESELTANLGKFEYAGYSNGSFYFVDERFTGVYASEDGGRTGWWKIDLRQNSKGENETGLALLQEIHVHEIKGRLGLEDTNEEFKLISVCGTLVPSDNNTKMLIPYQQSDDSDHEHEESSDSDSRRRKGVWLHPRFHQFDPSQTNW